MCDMWHVTGDNAKFCCRYIPPYNALLTGLGINVDTMHASAVRKKYNWSV